MTVEYSRLQIVDETGMDRKYCWFENLIKAVEPYSWLLVLQQNFFGLL